MNSRWVGWAPFDEASTHSGSFYSFQFDEDDDDVVEREIQTIAEAARRPRQEPDLVVVAVIRVLDSTLDWLHGRYM